MTVDYFKDLNANDKECRRYGARPIPVPYDAELEQEVTDLGGVHGVIVASLRLYKKVYADSDLSATELGNCKWALGEAMRCILLSPCAKSSAIHISQPNVSVVDFMRHDIRGVFVKNENDNGHVTVSRQMLASKAKALRIFIHEVAHNYGKDGSREHQQIIEDAWEAHVSGEDSVNST